MIFQKGEGRVNIWGHSVGGIGPRALGAAPVASLIKQSSICEPHAWPDFITLLTAFHSRIFLCRCGKSLELATHTCILESEIRHGRQGF